MSSNEVPCHKINFIHSKEYSNCTYVVGEPSGQPLLIHLVRLEIIANAQ